LFNIVPGRIFLDEISLAPCHSCTVGYLSAGGQFLPRSTISLSQHFLKMFPLRHASVAQQDPFMQAAANFFWDP
jgi:hypothetical protein